MTPHEPILPPVVDFWVSSGHFLLDRAVGGGLLVTQDFVKAYLARPEMMPPVDACAIEYALHEDLLDDPLQPVANHRIAAIADPDARENWIVFLNFRDRLLAESTIEQAYERMIREGVSGIPPLFLTQLHHVLLREALEGLWDPWIARAGELFFRTQRVTIHDGAILLADAETIEKHETNQQVSPLLSMLGNSAVVGLDIMRSDNAYRYWGRNDAFDMVLDLGGDPSGRHAIAAALKAWVRLMHGLEAGILPIDRIDDKDCRWLVGLDANATRICHAIWHGNMLDVSDHHDVVAMFRIDLPNDARVFKAAQGRPVYALLAMDRDRLVRLKPQNILAGLPLSSTHQYPKVVP